MIIIIGNRYHLFSNEKKTLKDMGKSFLHLKKYDISTINSTLEGNEEIELVILNIHPNEIDNTLSHYLDNLGAKYSIIRFQAFIEQYFLRNELDYHELIIHSNTLKHESFYNKYIKSILDFLSSAILLVVLSPVIGLIALLIKFADKGNVIYRQERIGKHGKVFSFYKFRTMYVDSEFRLQELLKSDLKARDEWTKNYKLTNDPRITTIGKVLRKTSLDELPQLFNVLKFDISLVGPRALPSYHLNQFSYEFIQARNMVKPGITGEWQTSGRSNASELEDFLSKDLKYLHEISLLNDIRILIKTVKVVFIGRGAI